MFRKMREWNKLVKFIKSEREKGNSEFMILTTSDEIIVGTGLKEKDNTIRLKQNP